MSKAWMPLYNGDLDRKTKHLGAMQFGIYVRLILWAWDHKGTIPLDARQLARISGCEPRLWWRFGAPIVTQFFDIVDASTATQKRVLTELHRSDEISNKRKAAALQKHSKWKANAEQMHTQSQSHSPSKVNVTVTPSSQSKAPARSGSNGPRASAGNATIGERLGDYVWDGTHWKQEPEPFGQPPPQ
jgi:uncharacterized protein YdaU (DUF1376 family)